MDDTPFEEPCGCQWGSADQVFKPNEYVLDRRLKRFTECLECGAVWTTKQDNDWVSAASQVSNDAT